MRVLMSAVILPLICTTGRAQTVCDTLPISYDGSGIVFNAGTMSFGDSVIIIPITNTSNTPLAYPQAKLVPLTPLPPGMTQNTHWDTFASSWNPGQTMPANCFFEVAQPIPPDFTVTFEMWVTNLPPLLVNDSCLFDTPFIINLNPAATGLPAFEVPPVTAVWPVPANDELNVRIPAGHGDGWLVVHDGLGGELCGRSAVAGSVITINIRDWPAGVHHLSLLSGGVPVCEQKVLVAH